MPFTEATQQALRIAQDEAIRMSDQYVATEHILLALPIAGGPAARILSTLGTTSSAVRSKVEARRAPLSPPRYPEGSRLAMHPLAKQVLESAMDEGYGRTSRDPNTGIDTDDILIGLLIRHEGLAAQVLSSCGVTLESVRRLIRRGPPATR
jgi:ATP-dependent Clp protease ATP-binding subunit ClpA